MPFHHLLISRRLVAHDVPDPFEPGGLGGGSPCPPGRGGRRCRPARCGGADPCGAAQRLTGPFSRMRGAEACRGTRRCPCASERRRGAGTRRIMSEALNSDSTNSASFLLLTFVAASGRPSQSQVAGLRYSDQFAHGGDGVIAFFAADEPCGARSPTFSREEGSRFFQELASLRATRGSPPAAWRSRPTPRRPRGPGPRRASSCTWRPSPPTVCGTRS